MRIPIKVLKEIADKYSLSHAMLFAHHPKDKTDHIVTYGKSLEDCSAMADYGNRLKDFLGWPETLHAQPSRVKKLKAQLTQANARIAELESVLRVVGVCPELPICCYENIKEALRQSD